MAQGKEDAKPGEQSQGITHNSDPTGFLAPPQSGVAAPSVAVGDEAQIGMAAEAGNAPTDVPSGIQADASAHHPSQPTGRRANLSNMQGISFPGCKIV